MKKWLGIGIIVVVLMLVFVVWASGMLENPYWETETAFGKWQEEIIIKYADGTEKSLKILQFQHDLPLTIYHGGKDITHIGYKIFAKGEGTGYNQIQLDCGDIPGDLCINVKIGGNNIGDTCRYGTIKKDLDTTFLVLWDETNLTAYVENDPSTYPDGTYTVKFTPTGDVRYRGLPGGDWKYDAGLPPGKSVSITVDRSSENEITLSWKTTVTTS